MALYSKKEFLELCKIEAKHLTTYIGRQKIVCTGEYIDDSLPVNSAFIKNRLLHIESQKKNEVTEVENLQKPVENVETKKAKALPKNEVDTKKLRKLDFKIDPSISRFDLDNQKKVLDIQKTTEEVEILKVKKEKLHGIVIPTETVKILVTQLSKSILNEFKNGTENILTKITAQANLNRNQVAELRLEFIEIINAAVNAAVDDSQKSLKNIVTDFAIKKEVGERN